jgi:hypothetical protein
MASASKADTAGGRPLCVLNTDIVALSQDDVDEFLALGKEIPSEKARSVDQAQRARSRGPFARRLARRATR